MTAAKLTSAVEDVSLDDALPFDPNDERPEPVHPEFVWVLCDPACAPKTGIDYATPAEMRRRLAPTTTQGGVVNPVAPVVERSGVIRLEFATREEFDRFVEQRAPVEPRVYMKVAEYAAYRGVSKGTIEARIREGMPIEGRSKHRRVHVERADEWFRQNPLNDVRAKAKEAALHAVAASRRAS
jgi:hypothetical protein